VHSNLCSFRNWASWHIQSLRSPLESYSAAFAFCTPYPFLLATVRRQTQPQQQPPKRQRHESDDPERRTIRQVLVAVRNSHAPCLIICWRQSAPKKRVRHMVAPFLLYPKYSNFNCELSGKKTYIQALNASTCPGCSKWPRFR